MARPAGRAVCQCLLHVVAAAAVSSSSSSSTSLSAAPSMRRREFYFEEIHHRTKVAVNEPLTAKELVDSARLHIVHIFYFVLLVIAATFVCIVTEGDVPLVWILPAVAAVSVLSFRHLDL